MVRPRESYDQHLIDTQLRITPEPSDVRWLHDVFGNAVAIATFDKRAKDLVIDSRVRLDHTPAELQNVDIERYARFYPFTYSSEEMPDLLRSIERQHHDPLREIDTWARRFVAPGGQTDTLAMLSEMTAAIKREFTYVQRPEKGTQSPIETLAKRKGTCRDYAMLMIEAVRALGFAARFVSGYVYNPTRREHRTGGGNNWGLYSNPAFDRMMDEAQSDIDLVSRGRKLAAAEAIALKDHAAMPLWFWVSPDIVWPYVKGWKANAMDYHRSRWVSIDQSARLKQFT